MKPKESTNTLKNEKIMTYKLKESVKGSSPNRTKSIDEFTGSQGTVMTRNEVVLPKIDSKVQKAPLAHSRQSSIS